MKKKITLTVNGSRFDIDVESKFAEYLEAEMSKELNVSGNINFRELLQAYVRTKYSVYELQNEIEMLVKKIDDFCNETGTK
jgi:sulfur relay (sulfurtransferase) DsrC/TusE family protein